MPGRAPPCAPYGERFAPGLKLLPDARSCAEMGVDIACCCAVARYELEFAAAVVPGWPWLTLASCERSWLADWRGCGCSIWEPEGRRAGRAGPRARAGDWE